MNGNGKLEPGWTGLGSQDGRRWSRVWYEPVPPGTIVMGEN